MTFLQAENAVQTLVMNLGLTDQGEPLSEPEAVLVVGRHFSEEHGSILDQAQLTKPQDDWTWYLDKWRNLIGRFENFLFMQRIEKKLLNIQTK